MAERPERFSEIIIAEMRGVMRNGSNPFWDHVISKFIDIPFTEADKLTGMGKKQFISDLMPRYPIYTDYLPKEAQEVIDCVHEDTAPALAILEREGFRSKGYVDIFDTGPLIECELNRIYSVANSRLAKVAKINPDATNKSKDLYIISTTNIDIRVCMAGLVLDDENNVTISAETAEALNIGVNDQVRYVSLKHC